MSKFRLLRRRDDYYRHFTALDIGTDLIKVLVVRREQDGSGTVLGVGRAPQHPSAMSGGAIADIDAVIDAANGALEAAEDMAGTVPGQAIAGIAGELVKGFSSSVQSARERPDGKVDRGEMRELLKLVEKRALREAQHLLELDRGYGDLEARLVHSSITQVRMDGYPVSTPIGFQGKNLDITVFNTFAPMTQIGAIESVLKELDLELAGAVAQPYALARACAGKDAWEQGAIFVDIGGGTTDVALLREGGVEGTRMFNLGGRAFTRRLALAMGVTYEEAEARKLRHSEGLLSPDQERQVRQLVSADVEVLLQGLALCLRDLNRGQVLPTSIFVCGGGSLLPEVIQQLNQNAWSQGLPFSRPPQSRLLRPHDVMNLKDSTGELQTARDVGPMGLANHALRVDAEDKDMVQSVMRGVLKAMKV
ncbi:MAG TPA: cell division FtsA domain-containing protein [Candidatus Acidoferrales bacterium]|nr:cell division FtsA domain-containing protein [Candidatus Acidoferrales bacterium]